jgi:hypothetical protein
LVRSRIRRVRRATNRAAKGRAKGKSKGKGRDKVRPLPLKKVMRMYDVKTK